jgi:hypothetical protein
MGNAVCEINDEDGEVPEAEIESGSIRTMFGVRWWMLIAGGVVEWWLL